MRSSGLNPDMLILRSKDEVSEKEKEKIGFFANL